MNMYALVCHVRGLNPPVTYKCIHIDMLHCCSVLQCDAVCCDIQVHTY